MTQYKTGEVDFNLRVGGQLDVDETLNVDGAATITGATTLSSTVTVGGLMTINSLKLVQAGGGTDATSKWAGAAAPILTKGNYFFTFTKGASTFRVPCWPTT